MDRLKIIGRTNWGSGFYIKFKAEKKSMETIKKIVEELGSDYFIDNDVIPKFSKYEKWKDRWMPIHNEKIKNLDIDIICGDKIIHMIIHKYQKLDLINNILSKHCKWAQVKYKKGFGSKQ